MTDEVQEVQSPPPYRIVFQTHGGIYGAGDDPGFATYAKAADYVRRGYALPLNFDMPGYPRFGAAAVEEEAKKKPLSQMRKPELFAYTEELGLSVSIDATVKQLRAIIEAELDTRGLAEDEGGEDEGGDEGGGDEGGESEE